MTHDASSLPFLAFATGEHDTGMLKQFAGVHGWDAVCVHQGDIATATEYLKTNPSPRLLLVELPSAEAAPGLLDALAEVCAPETKVITVGAINEYSFYCWLTDIGIFSYLLKPLSMPALDGALKKTESPPVHAAKHEKAPGKLIGVLGARGGMGVSTIALNLSAILADSSKKQVALIDSDPQDGSISLMLDIEPTRGLREVLEKPDRIDSLFIERVMSRPIKHLSVLSCEESLQDKIIIQDNAAESLLSELRNSFDVVILDIPRYMSPFGQRCITHCDQTVLVSELSLRALRDALRVSDLMRETLKVKPPLLVANRVGHAPRQEMMAADFEHGMNAKLAQKISFAPDIFMAAGGDIPALKQRNHAALKPLYRLAEQLVPELKSEPGAANPRSGLFKKRKKE